MKLFMCAFALFLVGCVRYPDDAKVGRAKSDMRVIEQACRKYYAENGEWPAQLEEIAISLEAGNRGLIDPWGKKYNFMILEMDQVDGPTRERPYIWTERTVDGKTTVYGWPEDVKLTEEMKDDAAKKQVAKNDARVIEQACKKYYLDNKKWPAKLTDIANLLEIGEKGLIDPWGKEYKFAIGKMKAFYDTEVERPFIWTERTVNGNIRVCGSKPPEEKKPEDPKDDATKEVEARSRARVLEQAMKKYYVDNGKWPAKIADVAMHLENGKKDVIDPWGKEYQFKIVNVKTEDGTEVERLYIWTERIVDGKTKVYSWPPEEKKKT
jgi:type II secretory pathway pseudopilin PulG